MGNKVEMTIFQMHHTPSRNYVFTLNPKCNFKIDYSRSIRLKVNHVRVFKWQKDIFKISKKGNLCAMYHCTALLALSSHAKISVDKSYSYSPTQTKCATFSISFVQKQSQITQQKLDALAAAIKSPFPLFATESKPLPILDIGGLSLVDEAFKIVIF